MEAFLDESTPNDRSGIYYVTAAVVVVADPQAVRELALSVVENKTTHKYFRWSTDKRPGPRQRMLDVLSESGAAVFAAVAHPVKPTRQTHARAQTLVEIATQLAHEHINTLVIESGDTHQDQRDRQTLVDLQHQNPALAIPTYRFATKTEPLLWLADAAAGIVSSAVTGKDASWLNQLDARGLGVTITNVEP